MASLDPQLDTAARALIAETFQPRRRARPRLAAPLHDAFDGEVETPEGALAVWRLGEGPATLLIHGWEDDNALWGPLIERLTLYGRAVVVVDLPGHGFSSLPLRGPAAAGRLMATVAERFGPVDSAVGHSFGCAVTVAALSCGLVADPVVLIAPPLPGPADARLRREGASAPAAVLARAEEILREAPQTFEAVNVIEAARSMRARALLVHSMDDEQCPASNSLDLAAAWPGAETLIVDRLGHRLVAQDADIVDRVARYIEDGVAGS